jgi:hypothetical protein
LEVIFKLKMSVMDVACGSSNRSDRCALLFIGCRGHAGQLASGYIGQYITQDIGGLWKENEVIFQLDADKATSKEKEAIRNLIYG